VSEPHVARCRCCSAAMASSTCLARPEIHRGLPRVATATRAVTTARCAATASWATHRARPTIRRDLRRAGTGSSAEPTARSAVTRSCRAMSSATTTTASIRTAAGTTAPRHFAAMGSWTRTRPAIHRDLRRGRAAISAGTTTRCAATVNITEAVIDCADGNCVSHTAGASRSSVVRKSTAPTATRRTARWTSTTPRPRPKRSASS
jgi:hypothetical protein